jgi:hypothetical protein
MAHNSLIRLADLIGQYSKKEGQDDALDWLQEHILPCHYKEFVEKYNLEKKLDPKIDTTRARYVKKIPDCSKINLSEKGKALNDITSWEEIYKLAKEAGAKYPECVAAQWVLESGEGRYTSGQNNFFGLKGKGTSKQTKEYIDDQWITIKDEFINFDTPKECVQYLVKRWYKDYKGYEGVNRAKTRNECAQLLVTEGYATDPNYAEKLQQIMDNRCKTPGTPETTLTLEKILDVKYEYQRDNKSGEGYRECFSSSCAMIARYYGKVKSDDEYNDIRQKFGDSTLQMAQVKTLQALGLQAKFITNGNAALLETKIRNNQPVAVGWLHYGSTSKPSGGGHWTCCIGFDEENFIFHDPNGKADMVNGGYLDTSIEAGQAVKYKRNEWLKRWEVDGKDSGWAIIVTEN